MNGVFFVNKKSGQTSHDVVQQIKKKFSLLKVGHTGTLDPLAEGLLLILVGKATKLNFLFDQLDKKYQGTIIFNHEYDTLDVKGKLITTKNQILTDNLMKKAFAIFHQKKYQQTPPMYSAIKIKGQKLYHLARKNIQIDIPPQRLVFIYHLEQISSLKEQTVDFYAHVSKGTYIRSLARDIASYLSTYGALSQLCRIAIGPYQLTQAKDVEQVTLNCLIPAKNFFSNCPQIVLNDYLIKLVKNGIYLDERQTITQKPFIVLDNQKKWIAYYEVMGPKQYAPKYFF
ncbi:tRNA pseudouridine(55) synthase TruB [Candidatus Phytoplasma phoenicium]|uniref:tRNA pseudouridine synthase B n=1 Tax=Candidatus Phytoplasma phoenicium TaxID=198422 RepID=A0A0L0MJ02_9MOLU|nr:tRNA pseudouridine(55) synthase TruB [Candidatus Phytoplasma phoenicium]KND62627.1 tRNA pseudouridine synthase B [Candidatus Phytoplasma phoenicium]